MFLRLFAAFMVLLGTTNLFASLFCLLFVAIFPYLHIFKLCAHRSHQNISGENDDENQHEHDNDKSPMRVNQSHAHTHAHTTPHGSSNNAFANNYNATHHTPAPSTPLMSRGIRDSILRSRKGKEASTPYICRGAPEYVSDEAYEREKQETTKIELAKLMSSLKKDAGDLFNRLSPVAQSRINYHLRYDENSDDEDQIVFSDEEEDSGQTATKQLQGNIFQKDKYKKR